MDPERREHLRETLRRAGIDEAGLSDERLEQVLSRLVEQAADDREAASPDEQDPATGTGELPANPAKSGLRAAEVEAPNDYSGGRLDSVEAQEPGAALRERLNRAGLEDGVLHVEGLWPAVRAWLLEPGNLPPLSEELVVLYVALCPPDPDDFGGRCIKAPGALRGQETVGLELSVPDAAFAWWFERTDAWRAAETVGDWIEMGPTTPSVDWPAYGDLAEWLDEVERSPEFRAASADAPLAFELRTGGQLQVWLWDGRTYGY